MNPFCGFGKRHVYLALGFVVVTQLAHSTYALAGKEDVRWAPLCAWAALSFLLALLTLACAVASDNLLERAGTGLRLVVAMFAAAVVTTLAVEALMFLLPPGLVVWLEGKEMGDFVGSFHRIAFRFTLAAGGSMLLLPVYAMLQASRRATGRLHAMQLTALAAERRVIEADLRATQGRVDPELLFDSLLEVDRAYERDVQAGQDALDALIRFLRAALPSDAAATATVAGEQELAEAYLALVAQRADASPQVDISVAPEARTLPMPAMLLLPLVRWALDGRSATRLQIHAQRRDAALEVSVRSNSVGSAASTEPNIAGVRERLARLFADHASLDVTISADARHVRLQIPVS
ncbi:MAG TPA: histidine kinase [Burkholderiales bacterium]|nr:histidine kinase [Burkholderiales bacterium]